MKFNILTLKGIAIFTLFLSACSGEMLIETESFENKGGWVLDPQFTDQMGSPYLMAHGLGVPVENATATIHTYKPGKYHIWVRTTDWAPGNWDPPGRFILLVNDEELPNTLGTKAGWNWEYAGKTKIERGENKFELKDLTGFNARCDAIYLSKRKKAPEKEPENISEWRRKVNRHDVQQIKHRKFDLVVVGGGIAGCAAAIAAAEEGLDVALVHDRPVLGGNASSEIRVHTLGIYGYFERILKMLDTKHYPNGSPEALSAEKKRHNNIEQYENLHLYLSYRAYSAETYENNEIRHIDARQIEGKDRVRFIAPLYVDCTGDGWIGYWAGADYFYGREARDEYGEGWGEYGELWSPEERDNRVMGSSLLWRSFEAEEACQFPEVPWAMEVAGDHSARKGTWHWEMTADTLHQIDDAEKIRDHMLKAIFGSFYNEKQKPGNENLKLEWASWLLGKRESRRIKGDYVFSFADVRELREFPDSVVSEIRAVDVHYQQKLVDPEKPDFLSEAMFYRTEKYYIPYRSLYSADIPNLFMAGRCFSCSHIGLGGPRVMRTTGQMGAAVGYAASLCKKYEVQPAKIYDEHLNEYMNLIMDSNNR
jgi:hypothetical protein